jgi:hypothetical protein
MRVQIPRLNGQSPDAPDKIEREALIFGLNACRAQWLLLGIVLAVIAVPLQLTVGLWCLVAYAAMLGCVAMSLWRRSQANRLKSKRNAG